MAFPNDISDLLTDDFNRADANPVDGILAGLGGWAGGSGVLKVVSNQLGPHSDNSQYRVSSSVTSSADCEIFLELPVKPQVGEIALIALRISNLGASFNCYGMYLSPIGDGSTCNMVVAKWNSATPTNLVVQGGVTTSSIQGIGLTAIGTTIQGYSKIGGVWGTEGGSATDSDFSSAGYTGIAFNGTTVRVDNLGAGPYGGGAVHDTTALGGGTVGVVGAAVTLNSSAGSSSLPVFDNADTISLIGGTPYTKAFTVSGNAPYLQVRIYNGNDGGQVIQDIKYDGVALTNIAKQTDSNNSSVDWWELVGPHDGTHNLVVRYTNQDHNAVAHIISYNNVNQSSPRGSVVGNFGLSTAPSVTVSLGSHELAVGSMGAGGTIGTGSTADERLNSSSQVSSDDDATGVLVWTRAPSGEWAALGTNLVGASGNNNTALTIGPGAVSVSGSAVTLTAVGAVADVLPLGGGQVLNVGGTMSMYDEETQTPGVITVTGADMTLNYATVSTSQSLDIGIGTVGVVGGAMTLTYAAQILHETLPLDSGVISVRGAHGSERLKTMTNGVETGNGSIAETFHQYYT